MVNSSVKSLLADATLRLRAAGCDAPRLDAELLLCHSLQCGRTALIVRANDALPSSVTANFEALLMRRLAREPLAYILGEKEFWSRPFRVTPDVLIPRPETEHLIEAVLARFPERERRYRFCDIGTGSGCIAVTLACEYPQAEIIAIDISAAALAIARDNASRHHVAARIDFRQGDMLTPLALEEGVNAIISNPPYVSQSEMASLAKELAFEPQQALTDHADGLQFLTTILTHAPAHLITGGYVIVETGSCGLPATPDRLTMETTITDLAGLLRGGIYRYP